MSGLQVTVRQLASYPLQARAGAADVVLLQQGGLGGPYYTTTPAGLLKPLEGASLAVGLGLSADAGAGNLAAPYHVLPQGGAILWNAYRGGTGYRTWAGGMAAALSWAAGPEGLQFGVVPQQAAAAPITGFPPVMRLDPAGSLRLHHGTLAVARDPGAADEVATMGWVGRATATSFNGRRGAVQLAAADIQHALGLAPDDPLASRRAVNFEIGQLLARHPFVWAFNGRSGNIWLSLGDVMAEFFRPGATPMAPTPPWLDNSAAIATTAWVAKFVWEKLWPDIAGRYAPIDSPQFRGVPTGPLPATDSDDGQLATTEWVRSLLSDIGAGVLQWNGRSGFVSLQLSDVNDVFTAMGAIPLAPTAAPGTTTQQIASTAFVTAAEQQIIDNSVWTWNTRKGDVVLALQDILDADGQAQTSLATSAPTALADGQFWFDPATNVLNIWDGADWTPAGGVVEIGDTEPATNYNGKLWWDSDVGDLFIYYEGPSGGQWVVANASAGSPGVQGPPGVTGPQGVQGPPGPALNPQGTVTGAPGSLPATGNPGDFWVDSGTGGAWAWNGTTGSWVDIGVIGSAFPDAPDDGLLYGREAVAGPGTPMAWESIIDDGAY